MKITRRQFALTAASAGAAAAARPLFAASAPAAGAAAMTEWYYADAIIMPRDTTPESAFIDVTGESTDWLSVFNLSAQAGSAVVTRYFENEPPRRRTEKLQPLCANVLTAQALPESELPRGKLHGIRVQADVPVVVQPVRAEHQIVNPPPKPAAPGNTFMSRIAHPGPLGQRETVWIFGNGFVEHRREGDKGWEESERITVLNPHTDREASIRISFHYPGASHGHTATVAPERVRTINFMDLPFLQEGRPYGLIVRSDLPVVVEQVRRAFPNFNRNPLGGWIHPGYPVGGTNLVLPDHVS